MGNTRVSIREALKDLLLNETVAIRNIFTNRQINFDLSELPSINIMTSDESGERRTLNGSDYIRTLDITLEVRIEATSSVDDDLDEFIVQIEDIIENNKDITGTVIKTDYVSTQITVEEAGEKQIGVATILFRAQYIA